MGNYYLALYPASGFSPKWVMELPSVITKLGRVQFSPDETHSLLLVYLKNPLSSFFLVNTLDGSLYKSYLCSSGCTNDLGDAFIDSQNFVGMAIFNNYRPLYVRINPSGAD